MRGWREGTKLSTLLCTSTPACPAWGASCQTSHEVTASRPERSLQKPHKTSLGEPLDSRERKQEGKETTKEMRPCCFWPRKGHPHCPEPAVALGGTEGGFGAAAYATGPVSHPSYFGKSNVSDAPRQQERARRFSQPAEPKCESSVPAARLKAKCGPCSALFAAHSCCWWCPGQQEACEKGQDQSTSAGCLQYWQDLPFFLPPS